MKEIFTRNNIKLRFYSAYPGLSPPPLNRVFLLLKRAKAGLHNLVIITLHNQGVVAPLHNPAIAWDETKEAQPG